VAHLPPPHLIISSFSYLPFWQAVIFSQQAFSLSFLLFISSLPSSLLSSLPFFPPSSLPLAYAPSFPPWGLSIQERTLLCKAMVCQRIQKLPCM